MPSKYLASALSMHRKGQASATEQAVREHSWHAKQVSLLFDQQQRKHWLPKISGAQEPQGSRAVSVGTDAMSAEAKGWLAEAGVAAQQQHDSDEDGNGGSYVKVRFMA
eukprot:scaffold173359_cov17-Tisochrysis_lutea.AAC.1